MLDAAEQEAILRPYLGLRLGEHRINLLLRRLTAALIDKGYVTSRAPRCKKVVPMTRSRSIRNSAMRGSDVTRPSASNSRRA